MKKTAFLLLVLLCSIYGAQAQIFKSVLPPDAFSDSLSLIVQDFRKNFFSIQGNQLPSQGEMDVYRSKITVPGALHCTIYRFHSVEDTTAGWQAVMYEGDSYESAVKIYKNTFRQLKKTKVKGLDKGISSFVGDLETPDENVGFAVTPLRLNSLDLPYNSFYGEIELTNTYDGWEVHLNLHHRKNDYAQN